MASKKSADAHGLQRIQMFQIPNQHFNKSDSESNSAAIYDPDGEELEEYTNSDSDSESEGAVLDEGYELHGENYDPVSDAEHDGYYWDD
ncbi:unnamed protein product [Sphagnum troendelagicum]|uniref:Uncharacterized protein n=1 Tax=Sphagnum jensenii TaxID=128206 RepID=A0ABP1BVA7_9BRYO